MSGLADMMTMKKGGNHLVKGGKSKKNYKNKSKRGGKKGGKKTMKKRGRK